jgi:plastocyanin
MQFSGLCRLYSSASLLALATALAAAFPRNEAVHAEDATIGIDNFTFAPERLTLRVGTTVARTIFHNTVTSATRLFKSIALDTNDSYSFTFTEPGTYEYFCSLHPRMTGTIVVELGRAR